MWLASDEHQVRELAVASAVRWYRFAARLQLRPQPANWSLSRRQGGAGSFGASEPSRKSSLWTYLGPRVLATRARHHRFRITVTVRRFASTLLLIHRDILSLGRTA